MTPAAQVVWISPQHCIGCTLCIDACPFDAIAGAERHLHAVLPDLCTACALCLPVCPVDCIEWRPDSDHAPRDHAYRVQARDRARHRQQRLRQKTQAHTQALQDTHRRFYDGDSQSQQAAIAAAVKRARQRRDPPAR